jgi:hypothetical protein
MIIKIRKTNKKGVTAGFLVGVMITLITFVLIAVTIQNFASQADEKAIENICFDSVSLRARTALQINTGDEVDDDDIDLIEATVKAVPVLCKTIDKEISGNREEIKQQVAEKMARCWWMFGEGRYEEILHSGGFRVLPTVFGFANVENECFNCYNLMITEDEIDGGDIPAHEMVQYLSEKKYSKVNITYLKYIQSYGGPGKAMVIAPLISPRQAYTISMMPKNKDLDDDTFWKSVAGIAVPTGIAVGVLAGGAVCILTNAVCIAVISVASTVVGETVALSGAIALTTVAGSYVGVATVVSGGALLAYPAYLNMMATMYGERDVSSIYFNYAEAGQKMCGSGDLAGE